MFLPSASLRFTHQVKFKQQLVEHALEKCAVALARALLVDFVDTPCGPGMHRRIHIAERPLVCRQLSVGMHVPLAQHQHELFLGEIGIDQRQRDAMKSQIPCRIPRILPLVGHGNDVGVIQMRPLVIAAVLALRRRRRIAGIAFEPVA